MEETEKKLSELRSSNASSSSASKQKIDEKPAITRASVEALGSSIVSVLDGLGLSKPLKRLSMRLAELSGGWRMRAALAQCLCHLDSIDVLLLDEPTNHCKRTSCFLRFFPSDFVFVFVLLFDCVDLFVFHFVYSGYTNYCLVTRVSLSF
jgi:ABC-type hemin transport system ATPase subunit